MGRPGGSAPTLGGGAPTLGGGGQGGGRGGGPKIMETEPYTLGLSK